jgi:hypothetical protein
MTAAGPFYIDATPLKEMEEIILMKNHQNLLTA